MEVSAISFLHQNPSGKAAQDLCFISCGIDKTMVKAIFTTWSVTMAF